MNYKILYKIYFYVFFLSVMIFSTYSACFSNPDYIKITSGSDYLGEFTNGNMVYINPDLDTDPLKFEFFFEGVDNNCIDQVSDVRMKLFQSGSEVNANSVERVEIDGVNSTKVTFDFRVDFYVTDSFMSSYYVDANGDITTGNFYFDVDLQDPIFQQFAYQPTGNIFSPGTSITVDYIAQDSESGLKSITISGPVSKTITFDSVNRTFTDTLRFNLTSSSTLRVVATDKFDQSVTQEVSFVVDNTAPVVENLEKVYSYDGSRKVSFTVDVSDESFQFGNTVTVIGNFSEINPSYAYSQGQCVRFLEDTFTCNWNNIPINFNSTRSASFTIIATDSLGNEKKQNFNEEIFVDLEGPVITKFEVLNYLNNTNIFNAGDRNVRVVLEFRDESIRDARPTIRENFGLIQFATKDCTFTNTTGRCVWNLGTSTSVYENFRITSDNYAVNVIDYYGNYNSKTINVSIDNAKPVLNDISIIETESIKDNVIKSQEVINFRLHVEDENIFTEYYEIYADFSNIDFEKDSYMKVPVCNDYNVTTIQCDFNGISVENGYMKRNVTFYIYDLAGNLITRDYEVEVFKVSDEVVSSYSISDMSVLNPLNRNLIKNSAADAWFEGKIDSKDPKMTIINYMLKSCNESELNPLLITQYGLFPTETIINTGQEDINNIVMRVELKNHPHLNDLNDKSMTCTMAIYKRDSDSVYPAELVDFDLTFSFYDVPRGEITTAHAQKVLEYIDEADMLGGYFADIYDIYAIFRDLCKVVSGGGGLINSVVEIWNLVQVATSANCDLMTGGGCTGEMKKVLEGSKGTIMDFLTDEDSFIKKACDYVTCSNGRTLMGLMTGTAGEGNDATLGSIPGLDMLVEAKNFVGQACTIDFGDMGFGTSSDVYNEEGVRAGNPVIPVESEDLPPVSQQGGSVQPTRLVPENGVGAGQEPVENSDGGLLIE